jgi:hypothetical protein
VMMTITSGGNWHRMSTIATAPLRASHAVTSRNAWELATGSSQKQPWVLERSELLRLGV